MASVKIERFGDAVLSSYASRVQIEFTYAIARDLQFENNILGGIIHFTRF